MSTLSGICKQSISSLTAGTQNSLIIGIMINSLNMRTFDSSRGKFNHGERAVWTFTLRDSENDFINVTVWGSTEFVKKLSSTFHIGNIIEVINAKVINRRADDRNEIFVPDVTSPYGLTVNEGVALIQNHDAPNREQYEFLLAIPTNNVETLKNLSNILENIQVMEGQYVNLMTVVTFIGNIRNVITRDGRSLICRNIEVIDGSVDQPISLMLWETEWVRRARMWVLQETVLFLTNAQIAFDSFKKKTVIALVRKTIITDNPNIPEAEVVRTTVRCHDPDNICSNTFAVPDPACVTVIMSIQEISERLNKKRLLDEDRVQFATKLRATITDIDLDKVGSGLTVLKCTSCKRTLLKDQDSCMNLNCSYGNGTQMPRNVLTLNLKLNLKDETGYLIGCRLSGDSAERAIGHTAAEIQNMLIPERENLKWKYVSEECNICLHILGPTSTFSNALYNILSLKRVREDGAIDNDFNDNLFRDSE